MGNLNDGKGHDFFLDSCPSLIYAFMQPETLMTVVISWWSGSRLQFTRSFCSHYKKERSRIHRRNTCHPPYFMLTFETEIILSCKRMKLWPFWFDPKNNNPTCNLRSIKIRPNFIDDPCFIVYLPKHRDNQ